MKKVYAVILFFLIAATSLKAQEKFTISGHIKDKTNGEELIGAAVYIDQLKSGTVSNVYGFYSITIPKGEYTIIYSYLGYQAETRKINLDKSMKIEIELDVESTLVNEVVITGEKKNKNVEAVEMSVAKVEMKMVKQLPAFMGEVDIIKSVQMLPGIQSGGEGSSGLYVRGGGPDENLLQLDEAPVYNASHLMGFFSVFNSDAIKDLKVYKGGIPAQYGGRASSVLDIRMKDGNLKKFSATGAISNLASRLTIETPIIKDRWSFIASGRRTYADLVGKAANIEQLQENALYFWDLNGKTSFIVNDKNKIYLSAYSGDDHLGLGESLYMRWGNLTTTLRWNHLFSDKLFLNTTVLYSKYDYNLGVPGEGADSFDWRTKVRDRSVKLDFSYFPNPNSTIKFGEYSIYHHFEPGKIDLSVDSLDSELGNYNALEHAMYISNEQKLGLLTLAYGARLTLFQYVGKGEVFEYRDPENPTAETQIGSTKYDSGEIIKNFWHFEPRFSAKYTLDEASSVKASYNRMVQNLHLITNTNSPTPFDIYLPSSKYIDPLIVDQVAAGYFRNFADDVFETSVEVYYKNMQNVIDYKPGAELLLNNTIETELLKGKGFSYGLELMVKKQVGDFTGWVAYTYAKTKRKVEGRGDIEAINNGNWYSPAYDRTHDFSFVGTYNYKRWTFSANWIYATGNAFSVPETKYLYQGNWLNHYSERNGYRIPAYHRLDVSTTYQLSKPERNYQTSLNFSVYNVYNRRNAYSVYFRANEDNPENLEAVQLSIIGAPIPALSFNFTF